MRHNVNNLLRLLIILTIIITPSQILSQELDWKQMAVPGEPSGIIAVSIQGEDTLYAIGNDAYSFGILGIYKSVDFGTTWEFISPDPQPGTSGPGMDLDVDANGYIYHVDRNTLKSTDGGQTWEEIDTGGSLFDSDVELEIDSDQRLYIRKNGDNGIYLSVDGGSNWTQILSPPDNIDGMHISKNDDVYVYGDFGIQMSSDQGETWTTIYENELEFFTSAQDGRLVATNDKKLFYSDDNGDNWTEIEQDFFFNQLSSNNHGVLYAIGANVGVLISEDGGESWTEEGEGLFEPNFGAIEGIFNSNSAGETILVNQSGPAKSTGAQPMYVHDPGNKSWNAMEATNLAAHVNRKLVKTEEGLYAIFGLRLFFSNNNGESWQEIEKPDGLSLIAMAKSSNGDLFLGSSTSIYRSQNDGENWHEIPEDDEVSGIDVRASDFVTTDSSIIFTKYLSSLFRFNNETEKWTRIGDNLDGSPNTIWFNEYNQQLYAATSKNLYTTEDNGDTWIQLAPDELSRVAKLTFVDENIMYALTISTFLKSTDGGNNWTEITDSFNGEILGNANINRLIAYDDGKIVAHANNKNNENTYGLFISEDDGETWSRQTDFIPGSITQLQKFDNSVYVGTAGQGIYSSDGLTSTSTKNGLNNISGFTLYQNYPNPFNPSTIIKYELSKISDINLKVYNILGQEVDELVNNRKAPGSYSVEFDASNLSSGIYIYRLKTENYIQTRKMLLVK